MPALRSCVALIHLLSERMAAIKREDIGVCSIVRAELYFGAYRSSNPKRSIATVKGFLDSFQTLPFDDQAAMEYGKLRAALSSRGTIIGPNDLLIAAIALVQNAVLVTHNMAEFSRVPRLAVEDWES